MPPSGFNESMVDHLKDYLLECFEALREEHPTDVYAGLVLERQQIARALAGNLCEVGGSEQATRAVLQLVDAFYQTLTQLPARVLKDDLSETGRLINVSLDAVLAGVRDIHITPEGKAVKKTTVTA